MKKFIIAVGFCSCFAVIASAAAPDPGFRVLQEFRKEFPSAESVDWSEESGFSKASFVLAGKRIIAFFSKEGKLEGSMREIFYDQLPLSVMTAIDRKFEKHEVLRVREINNAEGTHYKIRLDAGKKKYQVRVKPDGNISEVTRLK
jgi:hypothetical protein